MVGSVWRLCLGPFALLLSIASVLFAAALYKNSLRLLVIALGVTLFAELNLLVA